MKDLFSVDITNSEWKFVMDGIEQIPLRDENGELRYVVRFAPGAKFLQHTHKDTEELFVLDGALISNDVEYGAGSYLCYGPNTEHEPWSEKGCLVLVMERNAG
ncbi:cupin domain-containing protein [Bacillus mycoides]|uniref:cupin domain-containing protein n=1 Tax=Bacillus TaxID=1386 RepID=UPI0018F61F3E|nr:MULTISPECIES: cupin domain-containing protein [Bacillus cereus group]MBJ7987107.1 cupin domain-containing protein [Bacillus cereus]MED1047361.1 cupin domain-containing protein [Bacillus mycoides]QWG31062.1 cupin domain-containing protein [Bacillus mycoides]HDR3890429.1 cupin domain-containing protein [Bacillus cereus]HDR7613904.1 cupin domain-containing protein [Bacillus mycoides]